MRVRGVRMGGCSCETVLVYVSEGVSLLGGVNVKVHMYMNKKVCVDE